VPFIARFVHADDVSTSGCSYLDAEGTLKGKLKARLVKP
jgi:hypothetical protein